MAYWQNMTPTQIFVGSFALLILIGTLGFKSLPGLYTDQPLSWLDALFTATSAVCVTGLVVQDTSTYFTWYGQAYILLLIQLGGLGMLTFTSLVLIALGGRLSLRQEALSSGSILDVNKPVEPKKLLLDVVRFTFILESIGAAILYGLWVPKLGWAGAAWPAVFHSISAFCNAGFSTHPDSLVGYQSSPFTLLTVSILIVTGGLGFLALEEVYLRVRASFGQPVFRLSLHTRLAVVTTAVMLLAGTVIYLALEWSTTLHHMTLTDKASNAWFMSVTSRTAGFNTVDYQRLSEGGQFFTILLMAIGGSPGGTAGGLKTTTVALLVILAYSRFRGLDDASVWSRSIRKETLDRAVGLFVVTFTLLTGVILLLSIIEGAAGNFTFLDRMFETVSAFSTVGLSTGYTDSLSSYGRVLIILMMFTGRVGPLAVVTALAIKRGRLGSKFRYAYEDVAVG